MSILFKVDEKAYQIKALLEVMQDGLCNDVVGINQEHYAASLRVVMDKVEEIQADISLEFAYRRGEVEREEPEHQYDEDGEDSLFAGASLFGAGAQPIVSLGDDIQDSEPEESEAGEEDSDRFATGSFGVTLTKEHEDGSATFEVHGSKEQMQKLFSAFFADALTRGIDGAEQSTAKWTAEKKVIKAAENLESWLRQWEVIDELDYDPEVKVYRHELTEALNTWRGAVSQAKAW